MRNIAIVGLGPLGRMISQSIIKRRQANIVAAIDLDPNLAGKPFNTVIPNAPDGVNISGGIDDAIDWQNIECAVVATSSDLARVMPTLRLLLSRSVSAVSTCEELLYPWLRHQDLADEIDSLARANNARVLGTGVNPGFLMDTLPVVATAVSRSVKRVEVWRIQDATTRRIPFQRKIGATLDDAAFEAKKQEGTLRHVGLAESLIFACHYLGLPVERWDETLEAVKVDRPLKCELGDIPVGHACGVRQVATAYTGDGFSAQLTFQAAIGQADPHDRVRIDGEPPLDFTIKNGVHGDIATTAITINAIASAMEANPGLHTMATVPPVRYRAPESH